MENDMLCSPAEVASIVGHNNQHSAALHHNSASSCGSDACVSLSLICNIPFWNVLLPPNVTTHDDTKYSFSESLLLDQCQQ
jgi:hypothetical protein